jgi:hypothetical protein
LYVCALYKSSNSHSFFNANFNSTDGREKLSLLGRENWAIIENAFSFNLYCKERGFKSQGSQPHFKE